MNDVSAIEIRDVSKEYPGNRAIDKISFSVGLGDIHGFLGPNGAGKSTTMRMITGLTPQSSGIIKIFGKEIHSNKSVQEHVGFLPEQPPLYLNMKVLDYLNFVKDLHDVGEAAPRDQAIEKCGLGSVKGRLIGNLSKGFRQRVGIAASLVHGPKLIILDEPTVGLDPAAIDEIRNLILSLKKDHTIFLSTHHLHEVEILCSHITVINKGKILKSGPIEELKKDFSPRQVISLEVSNWNAAWETRFSYAGLEIKKEKGAIYFSTTEKKDIRPELCRKVIELGGELFSVSRKEVNVEDIFRSLTGAGK